VAQFDQREGSSDGGALLLKAADRHLCLVAGLASCLRDERQVARWIIRCASWWLNACSRIACGYPDANDSAPPVEDPIHKLLLDRDPIEGRALASQPTLSRFENGVGVEELYRSANSWRECDPASRQAAAPSRLSRHHRSRPDRPSPTHGARALSFFNGPYDTWCYCR